MYLYVYEYTRLQRSMVKSSFITPSDKDIITAGEYTYVYTCKPIIIVHRIINIFYCACICARCWSVCCHLIAFINRRIITKNF